jgi:hypothetical protein
MKLKVTNKFTADVLELEGTEEELTAFMQKYRPGYNNYPWWGINAPSIQSNPIIPNVCILHDFDYNSTYPTCKKCGVAQTQFQPWVITTTAGGPSFITNESMQLKDLKSSTSTTLPTGVFLSGNSEAMAAN